MRPVNLAYPRSQAPPARRGEDPPEANFSGVRHFEAGRTAVVEPLAPEPTADFVEAQKAERPAPQPVAFPVPKPAVSEPGSRFFIWKQDPSVGELGRRLTLVPTMVLNGPRNARIDVRLIGTTPVVRNADGDYLFPADTPEADCAHTFALVQQTLSMYERARGGATIPWAWNRNGNTDVVTVFPRAGRTANAFYTRAEKALKFYAYAPNPAMQPVYTCRSPELVAHQAAHAILDGIKPAWLGLYNPAQTGGLHEAFADLTAIFVALSHPELADSLIAMTRADLHAKNFLTALAERPGTALGRPSGLRNADNDLKLSQVSNEVHQLSQIFTGAMYEILADIYKFERIRQRETKDPVQVLIEVGRDMASLLISSLMRAPHIGATFVDVINEMLMISREREDPPIYRAFIYSRFAVRKVVEAEGPLAMIRGEVDWENPEFSDRLDDTADLAAAQPDHPSLVREQDRTGCCGTMQLPEYAREQRKLDGDLHRLCQEGQTIREEELLADELAELRHAFE